MQLPAEDVTADGRASPDVQAGRVRWLTVARRAWPLLTLLAVAANLLALPEFARSLVTPTIRHEYLPPT